MRRLGAAAAGGGLLGLLALGLLVGLRGTFHPADLVVVLATAGSALLVQHLLHSPEPGAAPTIDPAALDAQVRNLREARETLRKTLASAIDERMDAALAVARVAAGSAREGERLAALAEELRASAERLRGEMDSISRLLNDGGGVS